MHDLLIKRREMTAVDDVNIDSLNDTHEFVFAGPVALTRVGFVVTTAMVNATASVQIAVRRRPVAGADANHVELATFTLAGIQTRAVGSVMYKDLAIAYPTGETAEDGWKRFRAPNAAVVGPLAGYDPFIILPGQSLELKVTDAADSGAGRAFIEYNELPFSGKLVSGTNVFRDVTNA